MQNFEQQFAIVTRSIFEQQREAVERLFTKQKTQKSYSKKSLEDDVVQLFALEQWTIDLSEQLKPLYAAVIKEAAQNASSMLPFAPDPKQMQTAFQDFIDQRVGKISKDINEDTQKRVVASLKQGLAKGETVDELRVRLNEEMGDTAAYRSERIARTESKRAASQADLEVWQNSDIVEAKEWYTQGSNPCPWCATMDKKVLTLDGNFFDLGQSHDVEIVNSKGEHKTQSRTYSYEAIAAPPLHPSCRCILLPVIKKF